jgi:PST family polysaccharide transporter
MKWGSQGLTWIGTIIVARLLSPEDYGLVAMAAVLLGVSAIFNDFGLGAAVVAMRHLSDKQITQLYGLSNVIAVAVFLVVCLLSAPIGQYYGAPEVPFILMIMGLEIILVGLRSVPCAILQKELRFKFLALLEGGQATANILMTVCLAALGAGYWALVAGRLFGNACRTAVVLTYQRVGMARPSPGTLQEVIRFSSHVLVSRLAWYASTSSDVFIAGRLLGGALVGTYSMATSIANVPVEKVTALASRVMPAFYSKVQHDTVAMRRYFLGLTEGVALIAVPLAITMAAMAEDFVSVVLGDKWAGVVAPLEILSVWAAVRSIAGLVSPVLYVTDGSRLGMLNGLFCLATYPLAFWIGARWGTGGIAVAWLVVQPASWIAPYRHVFRALDLSFRQYVNAFVPALTSMLCTVLVWYGIHAFRFWEVWTASAQLLCEVSIGVFVYTAATILFHGVRLKRMWGLMRIDNRAPMAAEVFRQSKSVSNHSCGVAA